VGAPAVKSSGEPKPRTIGRAAREAGVHVETIRYYERRGLIPRPRARTGYRVYPDATVDRLRFIRNAQQLGFSLREIGELIGMAEARASCEEMCDRVQEKVAGIDQRIQQLTALRELLVRLLSSSPRRGPHTDCEVFGALSGGAKP
jgi:MerR family mercuric resistance operon transcriptional regulator